MVTEIDEGKGLVKTYWEQVNARIAKVEPTFAALVNKLNPDRSFPIYLAYYPYGAIEGDTESAFLPDQQGGYYRLLDDNTPKDIADNLGYGKNSSPLGMVLEKELELFIDLPHEGITIPWLIYKPGKIFPFSRILSKNKSRVYAPNGLLSSTAGARSVFMLPNIGSAVHHINLQRDFNVKNSAPKTLYEHWAIFKEIVNSNHVDCDWRCCVMYFSENWVNHILNDAAWADVKQYLHDVAWDQYEYERNRVYYDITFSMIQKKRNLKPNPYLADTARHLFTTALGAAPGYAPALDENALPLEVLQKVYVESYGLKKYFPTIMHPAHFCFEQDTQPIYYSLQHPSTHVFSPKSREVSSTLFEIRELEHILNVFVQELSLDNEVCSDTVIGQIAKKIKFNYFHNKVDRHRIVKPSAEMIHFDSRFRANFASDAPFVRGCISIRRDT